MECKKSVVLGKGVEGEQGQGINQTIELFSLEQKSWLLYPNINQ